MSEPTEISAQNLRLVRGAKGMNQQEVADVLGIAANQISKIEKGIRSLSSSEKAVLDWYFFGTMPPRLAASLDLQGTLEFTEDEWRLVELMARRAGQTPGQWIRSTILNYLAWSSGATENSSLRVAEPEPDLTPKKLNGTEDDEP